MTTVQLSTSAAPTTAPASVAGVTRREFLYYIWGASMALALAEMGGAILWFALPRFKPGEFGGLFRLELDQLPPPDTAYPIDYPDGRFWLVNAGENIANDPRTPPGYRTATGIAAYYKVCVHLGCIYKWIPTNERYECPCHGSKYLLSGIRLEGPARRNLDRFVIQAVDASGQVLAQTKAGDPNNDPTVGLPILIPGGTAAIIVDTGKRILGERNPR